MNLRKIGGNRIFLIHGSGKAARNTLKSVLEKIGFEVVVLSRERVVGAKTIIEKFEKWARSCNYAVALFTPDDKSFSELRGEERFRARQNVLIELGWFMAYLGRDRTFIVVVGDVEMPSDIVGIEVFRCGQKITSKQKALREFLTGIRGD